MHNAKNEGFTKAFKHINRPSNYIMLEIVWSLLETPIECVKEITFRMNIMEAIFQIRNYMEILVSDFKIYTINCFTVNKKYKVTRITRWVTFIL